MSQISGQTGVIRRVYRIRIAPLHLGKRLHDRQTPGRRFIYRHSLLVRITHWLNFVFLVILLMSGLQIFNAHPALYLGSDSDFGNPVLSIAAERGPHGAPIGVTTLFGHKFETTGLLGLSKDGNGEIRYQGFPAWATIPDSRWLAMGRRWHFFFAWLFVTTGLVYVCHTVLRGHLLDLMPTRYELGQIGHTIRSHLLLRFPHDAAATRYNVLQKLAYLLVIFGLGPLVVLTGLTMSPWLDSVFPWLLAVFGGRQSARTLHFVCAFSFVGFFLIHVFMVMVSGVWNNLRSMATGRYAICDAKTEDGIPESH